MRIVRTDSFLRDYRKLPRLIQTQTDHKLKLFLSNSRHPSLRVKPIRGHTNLWEGRITKNYRFIFSIVQDTFVLLRMGPHKLLDQL
jgi:mRNA interferase RelE/StbE